VSEKYNSGGVDGMAHALYFTIL